MTARWQSKEFIHSWQLTDIYWHCLRINHVIQNIQVPTLHSLCACAFTHTTLTDIAIQTFQHTKQQLRTNTMYKQTKIRPTCFCTSGVVILVVHNMINWQWKCWLLNQTIFGLQCNHIKIVTNTATRDKKWMQVVVFGEKSSKTTHRGMRWHCSLFAATG